jgi:hypothetical protein
MFSVFRGWAFPNKDCLDLCKRIGKLVRKTVVYTIIVHDCNKTSASDGFVFVELARLHGWATSSSKSD